MDEATDQSMEHWLEVMEGGDTLEWADVLTEILDSNPHAERPLEEFLNAEDTNVMEKWLILFLGCDEVPSWFKRLMH